MDKNKLLKRIAVFTGVSLTAMHVFNRISTYIATADNLLGAQVKELLSKHPETEVIFAGSDSLASAILSQLKKLNLKCPQDIGVVGFNDISLSKNFSPALTTVRLPSAEMGKLAAEVLIRQIKSNSVLKQQILLPVELKVRESTRKIR